MTKIETIKQIVINTIAANTLLVHSKNAGADWSAIKDAVSARYDIKDWVKEVRNPMQSLIDMDVIQRTDSIFDEVYIFTDRTAAIIREMAA